MNDRPSGVLMAVLRESRRFCFGSVDDCGRALSSGRDRGVAGRHRRLSGDGRRPVPRQQLGEARARPALGHLVDDAGQIGMRIEAGQLGRFNNGIDMRGSTTAFVAAQEQIIFSCNCNLAVIVPMSGRMSLYIIAGIRSTGVARAAFRASNAQQARLSTSN